MPLEKDYSLVADSTTSESIDEPAPPAVSRPTRTYGRKTNAVDASSQASIASRASVHHTAPPGLSEEIPPSSPNTDMSDTDTRSSFTFGWRQRMKDLDNEDSAPSTSHWRASLKAMDDHATAESGRGSKSGPQRESSFDDIIDNSFDGTIIGDATDAPLFGKSSLVDTNPTHSQATLISSQTPDEDVFVSPSTKRNTHRQSSPPKSFALSSPPRAPGHTRSRKRTVVQDSDSDDNIPSTTPASTKDLFAVPNTGSSGTHITSDDEELPGSILQSRAHVKEAPSPEDLDGAADEAVERSPHAKPADEKKRKAKKPTKQDQRELIKERGRLAEQRAVSIQQATNVQKYSVSNLLTKVQTRKRTGGLLRTYPSSDPIETFSSPAKDRRDADPAQMMQLWSNLGQSQPAAVVIEDAEADIPETIRLSNAALGKDKLKEFKRKLLEQRRPSAPQVQPEDGDYDDDDLEIVSPGKASGSRQRIDARTRSAEKPRVSEARKKQMQMAKITAPTKPVQAKVPAVRTKKDIQTKLVPGKVSQQELNRILAAEALKEAQQVKRLKEEHWTKYGGKLRKDVVEVEGGLDAAVEVIAQQGLQAAQQRQARLERGEAMDMDGDAEVADSEDEDWAPAGSGSEGEAEEEAEGDSSPALDDDEENLAPIHAPVRARGKARAIITSDSEGENDENTPKVGKYRRGTSEALTGDENDKENNTNLMYDRSEDKENTAVVRHALTSPSPALPLGRRTLRDLDTLRRDDSQDGARSPLKELLSEEEMAASQLAKGLSQSFEERLNQASPLSLAMPARVGASRSVAGGGRGRDVSATKDADIDTQMPPPAFLPLFGDQRPADGMIDFSQAESQPGFGSFNLGGSGGQLAPGFADLFESGTQGVKKDLFGAVSSSRNAPGNGGLLPPPPVFNFTQDVSNAARLAPAFVDEETKRRAQELIDEQQEIIAGAAAQAAPPPESEVYVNDLGFLTQTRPADSPEAELRRAHGHVTPFLARPSFGSTGEGRTPLRTLSFASHLGLPGDTPLRTQGGGGGDDDDDDDEDSSGLGVGGGRLKRLRKARDGSPVAPRVRLVGGLTSSSDESLSAKRRVTFKDPKGKSKEKETARDRATRNAFEVLDKAIRDQQRRQREAIAHEYLEEQADESDEDAGFGFGVKRRGDEEEEEGEELDGTLHELMDDHAMDQDTLGAERVHEKYMELAKEDDEKLEALHRDATTGALRRKRKNGGIGVDSDDSDDEDEEGGNDRAKRKMKRLRVSDRSDIRHLAKNEATRAFAETYNHSLKDDDDEFAYLQKDQYMMDEDGDEGAAGRHTRRGAEDGDEGDEDEDEDEQDENQFITPEEIRARAREMQMEGVVETMDPNDVSWMDQQMEGDDDDDGDEQQANGKKGTISRPAVKTILNRKKAPLQGNHLNPLDMEMALGTGFNRQAPKSDAKMMNETNKQWYKQEYKSRNAGTSRSVGASAVTGHAKKGNGKGRDGRGGGEKMEGGSGIGGVAKTKGVKAARSMLAAVANKDGLFG